MSENVTDSTVFTRTSFIRQTFGTLATPKHSTSQGKYLFLYLFFENAIAAT